MKRAESAVTANVRFNLGFSAARIRICTSWCTYAFTYISLYKTLKILFCLSLNFCPFDCIHIRISRWNRYNSICWLSNRYEKYLFVWMYVNWLSIIHIYICMGLGIYVWQNHWLFDCDITFSHWISIKKSSVHFQFEAGN